MNMVDVRRCSVGHHWDASVDGPFCPICRRVGRTREHEEYVHRERQRVVGPLVLFAAIIAILLLLALGFALSHAYGLR